MPPKKNPAKKVKPVKQPTPPPPQESSPDDDEDSNVSGEESSESEGEPEPVVDIAELGEPSANSTRMHSTSVKPKNKKNYGVNIVFPIPRVLRQLRGGDFAQHIQKGYSSAMCFHPNSNFYLLL